MSGSIKVSMNQQEAWAWAVKIQMVLTAAKVQSEICGSLRRGKMSGIGDIDMVVRMPVASALHMMQEWAKREKVPFMIYRVKASLDAKQAMFTVGGIPFNFFGANEHDWGAMVLFLTGSMMFNIILCGEAKKQGYKLNRYGLWLGDDLIAGKEEKQIFDALGLAWVDPKDRSLDVRNKSVLFPIKEVAQ